MALAPWLQAYLREEGVQRIEDSVRKAEKRTRGEIVPMIVRRSAHTGHVALTAGMLSLALIALIGAPFSVHQLPLNLLGALLAGGILSQFAWVRRLLTPAADRHQAAWRRAEHAFYSRGLHQTKGGTGVLLFLSLEDRQAVVLADKSIAKKVPVESWDVVCEMLQRGARQRDLANGYQAAIAQCAALLEKSFPAKGKHPNQLPDKLVIEDLA